MSSKQLQTPGNTHEPLHGGCIPQKAGGGGQVLGGGGGGWGGRVQTEGMHQTCRATAEKQLLQKTMVLFSTKSMLLFAV